MRPLSVLLAATALLACLLVTPATAAPGDPDLTFNGVGWRTDTFNIGSFGYGSRASTMHVQPDGKIVMSGDMTGNEGSGCGVARYTIDGALDQSFGTGGVVRLDAIDGSGCHDLPSTLDDHGNIVLAVWGFSTGEQTMHLFLARITPSGVLDTGWGGSAAGLTGSTATYDTQYPGAIQQVPGGFRVTVQGQLDSAVVGFDDDGAYDAAWGRQATPLVRANELKALPDGRMIVVGNSIGSGDVAVSRLNADGSADTSFGEAGTTTVSSVSAASSFHFAGGSGGRIAIDAQGRILIPGLTYAEDTGDKILVVVRLRADGAPDPDFGTEGIVRVPGSGDSELEAVTTDPAGAVVAGGVFAGADGTRDYGVLRLDDTGKPDASFGTGGIAHMHVGPDSYNQFPVGVFVDANGQIVVGGTSTSSDDGSAGPANYFAFGLARFEGGAPDFCVLPPDDGSPMPDADVPAAGTATPSASARSAASSRLPGSRAAGGGPTKARLRFGPVDAVGCFSQSSPGHWTNNSPTVRINGIDLITGSQTLDFDANAWKVSSAGRAVELRIGNMPIYAGALSHDFHDSRLFWQNGLAGTDFKIKGIKLNGKAVAEFLAPAGGTGTSKLTLTGAVPGTTGFKGFSVGDASVEIALQTSNDKGLQWPAVKGALGQLGLGPFGIKDGSFTYDFAEQAWSMEAMVGLPFPAVPYVGGGATVKDGHVSSFTAKAETKIPLGTSPFFLTALNFGFSSGDDGKTLTGTGGATVAFGPPLPVPGGENGALSGAVQGTYASGKPGSFTLSGDLKMVNVPLSDGRVAFTTDLRKVDFEGRARLAGNMGGIDLYHAEGKLFGWFDPSANWQAQGNVQDVRFLRWQFPNAQALASSKGMGVCVATTNGGPRIGFGYDYRSFRAISDQCDVGSWAAVRGKKASSAAASAAKSPTLAAQKVKVAADQELAIFAVNAASAPKISVKGPGLRFSTPADGSAQTSKYLLGQSEADDTTYVVLLHPKAGTYTISSKQKLGSVRTAQELPDVDVRAQVTGTGAQRTLHWTSTAVAGQTIRLIDSAKDGGARELVAAGKAEGSIAFTPDVGGEHTITAVVERAGAARATVEVARYGDGPTALSAATRLRAARKGSKATVSWAKVPGAAAYRLAVKIRAKTIKMSSKRPTATFKLRPKQTATVTVVAVAADGQTGPATRLMVRRR